MARWNGFWSRRTDVQRVELYTKVSLYLGVWSLALLWALSPSPAAFEGPAAIAAVVVTIAVMGAIGTWGVHVALAHPNGVDPNAPDARRLLIGAGVAILVLLAWGSTLPQVPATVVMGTVFTSAAWVVGAMPKWFAIVTGIVLYALGSLVLDADPAAALVWVAFYVFLLFILRVSLWVLWVVQELDEARGVQSRLAVAEERLRFSRDVHDVLGRHLSTIAVRSELAARLADRDAQRAGEEMLRVRSAAQEALREARALARGYRETDLQAELDGATSLLASAGIQSRCDLAALPARLHEPAGWVIREAITNVLRHADAEEVIVEWLDDPAGAGTLIVRNDGAHPEDPTAAGGSGISGLRERLAPLGATLTVRREEDRFALVAGFPADTVGG